MSAKIGEELLRQLKATEGTSGAELPVIITVKDSSSLDALQENGFKVQHIFDVINAVSGALPATAVRSVARLDEVQHIDYDGEVHALESEEDAG